MSTDPHPGSPPDERREAQPEPLVRPRAIEKAAFYGGLVAGGMAMAGGLLITLGHGKAEFGATMFIALPVATGFVAACFVRPWPAVMVATLLSMLVWTGGLLFTGLEGVVCVCMAAPLLIGGAFLGALLGQLVRSRFDSRANYVLFPLIGMASVFGVGQAEERWGGPERAETITSVTTLDAGLHEVWQATAAPGAISARPSLLLRIGLPVPRYCTLDGEGVGARRTCHFDSGVIEEEVTRWEPPRRLDMRIVRVTLPGRHWLGYRDASYTLEEIAPGRTRLVRTTTITSRLRPAWYWRHGERWGVETEHAYLFEHLTRSLRER
jgi:hypothetical protein